MLMYIFHRHLYLTLCYKLRNMDQGLIFVTFSYRVPSSNLGWKIDFWLWFLMVFSGQVAARVVTSIWPLLFLFTSCPIQNSLLFSYLIIIVIKWTQTKSNSCNPETVMFCIVRSICRERKWCKIEHSRNMKICMKHITMLLFHTHTVVFCEVHCLVMKITFVLLDSV